MGVLMWAARVHRAMWQPYVGWSCGSHTWDGHVGAILGMAQRGYPSETVEEGIYTERGPVPGVRPKQNKESGHVWASANTWYLAQA